MEMCNASKKINLIVNTTNKAVIKTKSIFIYNIINISGTKFINI